MLKTITLFKTVVLALVLAFHPFVGTSQALAADPAPAVVNINSADADTLATALDGVGKNRAREIVRYREAYGPFYSVEDLLEVRGVGQSILNNNRERIILE